MATEQVDTVVVGGGQAGIAMSEHLSNLGIDHVVLERARIAERWRSERWDSLVANGPAWHDRFPGLKFDDTDPNAFAPKERVADYFVEYADKIGAPVRTGVEVKRVTARQGMPGFLVETSQGDIIAQNVVAATGPFQKPVMPNVVPDDAPVMQIHSNKYRNPAQMPEGAVLVVGAGASGAQIAAEIMRAGRRVYLSAGPHDRPPRSYRGRDFCWWLGVLGKWDIAAPTPGTEHVAIAVSGANGGETVDFRRMAAEGLTLVGRTEEYENGKLHFAPGLAEAIRHGDANFLSVLDEADAYAERNGLNLPDEPEARRFAPDPDSINAPIRSLNLAEADITSIIWATGYALDYSWLQVNAFDAAGKPAHQRGVSTEPGVYFLGLPWLSRRGSSFIWGVWHDAKHVADSINTQRNYRAYDVDAQAYAAAE
ncbi:flavin-containing monooxygenase [Roseovarius arcticus]|uniref:flavin-containing monooxygenase n=1 Tax=Roseovarius arcticus TaxID=2547404 RepID=UPI001110E898|nr:NAD(P)/FAD-dependent oxidoreductase [Roseovarius arcticus]